MNKYQEALNYIVKNSCPSKTYCNDCSGEETCNCLAKDKIDILQELVDKFTSKKAITKEEFRPDFDPNTLAIVDGDFIIHYHCPICEEWLSCDAAIEPDELDCFCSKCGQHVKGVEKDE